MCKINFAPWVIYHSFSNVFYKMASPIKPVPYVCVPDSTYDNLMEQVNRLPPKKRSVFKGFLLDKYGVKTKVIYRHGLNHTEGVLMNWSMHAHDWVEVMSMSYMNNAFPTKEVTPLTQIGGSFLTLGVLTANGLVDSDVTDSVSLRLMNREVAKNHSGNHKPHQHKISVPTAAGQACRS